MKIIKEVVEGFPTVRITDDEFSYTYGYYSNNSWVDSNRIILKKFKYKGDFVGYVLIDLQKETEELLEIDGLCEKRDGCYLVFGNKLYCLRNEIELVCYDIATKETKKICSLPGECSFPHITNDGKFINFAHYTDDEIPLSECYVVDVENKSFEKVFEKRFSKPFHIANHMMICPTDKNKIFFSHEGDTFYISNRLWLFEKGKGMKCIAKQSLDEEQNLGDCFGHESWTADGRGLYFVKYKCSPKGPKGICYVNADGTGQRNAIYGKYPYWHVCAAPNGRFLAADTQNDELSFVCLIDTETGEEILIAKTGFENHPAHPHPSFSPDSSKVAYHGLADDKLTVCIVDTENIINGG